MHACRKSKPQGLEENNSEPWKTGRRSRTRGKVPRRPQAAGRLKPSARDRTLAPPRALSLGLATGPWPPPPQEQYQHRTRTFENRSQGADQGEKCPRGRWRAVLELRLKILNSYIDILGKTVK